MQAQHIFISKLLVGLLCLLPVNLSSLNADKQVRGNYRISYSISIKETIAELLVGTLCVLKTRATDVSTLWVHVVKPSDTPIQLNLELQDNFISGDSTLTLWGTSIGTWHKCLCNTERGYKAFRWIQVQHCNRLLVGVKAFAIGTSVDWNCGGQRNTDLYLVAIQIKVSSCVITIIVSACGIQTQLVCIITTSCNDAEFFYSALHFQDLIYSSLATYIL